MTTAPEIEIEIDESIINEKYLPYLDAPNWTQIFFGGSSSGKSKFLAQRLVLDMLKGGRNYLVARNVADTNRGSTFKEITKVINEWGVNRLFNIRETDMQITCVNGYEVVFKGLNDVEKLKSITPSKGILTDIWIEEATETDEEDVKQLRKRLRGGEKDTPKRIIFSFNPILQTHWLYKKYFKDFVDGQILDTAQLLIVHSTYKDNRFLQPQEIWDLEHEEDEYFYKVYTLGQWGTLGAVIFKNWTTRDLKNDPVYKTFDIFRHGLDFGYTNDPTAYNRMYYNHALRTLFITDEYHKRGVTNDQIAADIKPLCGLDVVTCDSAEPKSIQELNNLGINATAALKGKDSVIFGIQWLQQIKIVIDISCQETKNEFTTYQWKKNKDGETLNQPVDRDNHHIDDIRYAMEDEMMLSTVGFIAGGEKSIAATRDY